MGTGGGAEQVFCAEDQSSAGLVGKVGESAGCDTGLVKGCTQVTCPGRQPDFTCISR